MTTVKVQAVNGEIFEGTIVEAEKNGFVVVSFGMSEARVAVSELVA